MIEKGREGADRELDYIFSTQTEQMTARAQASKSK